MEFLVGIFIIVFVVIMLTREKKPKDDIEESDDMKESEEIFDDSDVVKLKVFYKGNEVQRNEIITVYEPFSEFSIEGYNLKSEKKVLRPERLYWSCGCPVVKFENQTGLTNVISCNVKGDIKRSISVKYQNGVTAVWKIIFN